MISYFLFELRRIRMPVVVVSLITGMMIFFSMSLFPEISAYMSTLSNFFNSGMMLQIFNTFNLDAGSMTTVLGFFSSYCTIWIVLLGALYFAYLAVKLATEDQVTGRYEFVLALPISRLKLILIKGAVLQAALMVYIVIVGFSSMFALNLFGSNAPKQLQLSGVDDTFETAVMTHASEIGVLLNLNETDFDNFKGQLLFSQLSGSYEALDASGIDVDHIIEIVGPQMSEPEALFDKMIASPGEYIDLLALENISADDFIESIEEERQAYINMKSIFLDEKRVITELYAYDPSYFLSAVLDRGIEDSFNDLLDGIPYERQVFSPYRQSVAFIRLLNMMSTVWLNGFLAFLFSLCLRHKERATQWIMGILFGMYFVNNLSGMLPKLSKIKYFSTFGYFPVYGEVYGIGIMNYGILIFLVIFSLFTYKRFLKHDLIN